MAALQASEIASLAVATTWDNLVFVGPLDAITPSSERPTAHFASAQELADLEELGQKYDRLILHPTQAAQLRTAYAEDLERMLASAGFTKGMFVSPRLPVGTAYAVVDGGVGVCWVRSRSWKSRRGRNTTPNPGSAKRSASRRSRSTAHMPPKQSPACHSHERY